MRDAGFFRDFFERSVAAISIEAVGPEAGEVEIDVAVVVIVAGADAAGPCIIGDPGFVGDVLEFATAEVAVKGELAFLENLSMVGIGVEAPAVDQDDVEPAVIVVIDEGAPLAGGFEQMVAL